jgi:VanZ family protein
MLKNFRWENDTWWWEYLRLDEFGINWTPKVPDKLSHCVSTFVLVWCFYLISVKIGLSQGISRWVGLAIGWSIMMFPWEIWWDGTLRYGASWRDMVANTIGAILCFWWLFSYNNCGQSDGL